MQKTILIAGATDGIGLETAKMLVSQDHFVLLHGRNPSKLEAVRREVASLADEEWVGTYVADLSRTADVTALANQLRRKHDHPRA